MTEGEREEFQAKIKAMEPNVLVFEYRLAVGQARSGVASRKAVEKMHLMEMEIINQMWAARKSKHEVTPSLCGGDG